MQAEHDAAVEWVKLVWTFKVLDRVQDKFAVRLELEENAK